MKPPHIQKGREVETAGDRLRATVDASSPAGLGAELLSEPRFRLHGRPFHGFPRILPYPRGRMFPGALGTETRRPLHLRHRRLVSETVPSGAPGWQSGDGDQLRPFGSNAASPARRVRGGGPGWGWGRPPALPSLRCPEGGLASGLRQATRRPSPRTRQRSRAARGGTRGRGTRAGRRRSCSRRMALLKWSCKKSNSPHPPNYRMELGT
ncbi:uncharacterized protein LOC118608686 isoform X2 [Rousettus aegyptiacus]|uniref:uncharacterized protein LOC118608686 isoform X2 n=1 Tax=Rousettus aegyptiacus TaxID=9407 RepID=UPI00168D6A68|nr:uncharacterized protein LOC118608686 isoform X2 [Rousettus aegyptiacus]